MSLRLHLRFGVKYKMGALFSRNRFAHMNVIYIAAPDPVNKSDHRIYPISWPNTFAELVHTLCDLYDVDESNVEGHVLRVVQQNGIVVCVSSESTFKGIVPSHTLVSPDSSLYSCEIQKWEYVRRPKRST